MCDDGFLQTFKGLSPGTCVMASKHPTLSVSSTALHFIWHSLAVRFKSIKIILTMMVPIHWKLDEAYIPCKKGFCTISDLLYNRMTWFTRYTAIACSGYQQILHYNNQLLDNFFCCFHIIIACNCSYLSTVFYKTKHLEFISKPTPTPNTKWA